MSDPCDLRPVAHVKRLQEGGTGDIQVRARPGSAHQPPRGGREVGRRPRDSWAGASSPADPDKLEAATAVGEDVQQALVVTSPELGLLVGHAEQVGVQLWEGHRTEQLRPGRATALVPPGPAAGPPAAAAQRCRPGGRTPRVCGPRCQRQCAGRPPAAPARHSSAAAGSSPGPGRLCE